MNVFIPMNRNVNTFFEEIEFHSKNRFIYDNYLSFEKHYEIVLIHWPEAFFNWQEPTISQINNLEKEIAKWKINAKIVYVVNNLKKHVGSSIIFEKLFDIVIRNSDVIVHYGAYSLSLFKKLYPEIKQQIIPHPLYERSFDKIEKNIARNKLGIEKDALVLIAPGSIRTNEERQLILNAFGQIKNRNKFLIVPKMYWLRLKFDFKGRIFLKKVFDFKRFIEYYLNIKKFKKSRFLVNYKFVDRNQLSLMMSSSDIVLVPRVETLNSGNIFLALSFKKVMFGPKIGNIKEVLEEFNMPMFDPKIKCSFQSGLKESLKSYKKFEFKDESLEKYMPLKLANEWDSLFYELNK